MNLKKLLPYTLPRPPNNWMLILGGLGMSSLPFWSAPVPYPVACIAMGQAAIGAGFNSSVYGIVSLVVMFASMLF